MAPDNSMNKRLVIIAVLPERGAYNASFMLAHALIATGFTVLYVGTADFRQHVTAQGFEFLSLRINDNTPAAATSHGPISRWQRKRASLRAEFERNQDILQQVEVIIRERSPALLLMDPIISSIYSAPFLKYGVPIMSLNTTLASTFSTRYPPVFASTIPENKTSLVQRVRFTRDWIACIWQRWLRSKADHLPELFFYGMLDVWRNRPRALIRKFGGRLRFGEYGYRLVAPELVMAPREFDFVQLSQTGARFYMGSCVAEARQDDPLPIAELTDDGPLLYCSLGTYSKAYPHAEKLFRATIEAISALPGWRAVIQVGNVAPVESFGPVRDGIIITRTVPQLKILECATVFITHGGFSSVRESIYFGVPMLVLPCWLDQPGNAARVVYHGAGLRADIQKVSTDEIRHAITELTQNGYREKVACLRTIFLQQKSCASVIPQIEAHLSRRRSALRP